MRSKDILHQKDQDLTTTAQTVFGFSFFSTNFFFFVFLLFSPL